ncbi:uncharacterized protein isoform X1 [Takifugu rubripes]|uniref:uncharacterized protein isoform X1 n=2 Tax=Takifugu rubripes TaxID=31033 RepID=UPI0011455EEA|nr:uncharacterized protein LOC105416909 isoform X1 [Takifugu rubripes]
MLVLISQLVVELAAMVFSLRFQCFGSLFWFCICFPLQKGCGIARGYPVGSHVGVSDPRPSDQLISGQSFNAETDSDVGKTISMNHISFASLQIQQENGDDAGSIINPGDQNGPKISVVQRPKHERSAYLHPFPLLVKQTQKETIHNLSFPTVQFFKRFVETMKNSYLTPGNDMTMYFHMARHVMENELALEAQETEDPTTDYRSQFPDLVSSTERSGYDENQDSDLSTELPHLAADGYGPNDYGSLETLDRSKGLKNAGAQNKRTYPVSHRPTDKMPYRPVFGKVPPAEALISLSHGPVPDLDSKNSERMTQESDSEDLLKYESPSGGFQLGGFQKKDLRVKIPADVLYSPHFGHKNDQNLPDHVPAHRESLYSSSRTHQSAVGEEESKGIYHSAIPRPSFGSAASNTDHIPQGHQGQVGAQLNSLHVPKEEANRRQPLRSQHIEPKTIFGINEPKQTTDDVQVFSSGGSGSAQWASSPYKVDYSQNFWANLDLPSVSDPFFWQKIGYKLNSRNSNMKNIISDNPNMPRSFFTLKNRGVTLKGGFGGPADAAIPHRSIQDTIYWPPRPIYALRNTVNDAFQRKSGAKRGLYSQTGGSISLPFYTTKTRSNYFRSKVSLLKSHFAPHNWHKTGRHHQKPASKYPYTKA